MSRAGSPEFSRVLELPRVHARGILRDYVDQNGHMNVRHYQDLYSEAFDGFAEVHGFTVQTVDGRTVGLFDMRHYTSFYREVLEGHEVAVHVRLIARAERRFHGMWFLVNLTSGVVANSMEFLTACVDLSTRRSTDLPEVFAASLDAQIRADAGLDWQGPLCGAIALR